MESMRWVEIRFPSTARQILHASGNACDEFFALEHCLELEKGEALYNTSSPKTWIETHLVVVVVVVFVVSRAFRTVSQQNQGFELHVHNAPMMV